MGEGSKGQLKLALSDRIRFLVDEDVPDSVAHFLQGRGHDVTFSRDVLGKGTPDEYLTRLGDQNEMAVLTCNAKHFKRLASRRPEQGFAKYRHVSLITLEIDKTKAAERLAQVIESIEFEYRLCRLRLDHRVFMVIKAGRFIVER